MSRISRCLARLDRSFERSRFPERFLVAAFEAALPINRRRSDRTDQTRGRTAAPPSRADNRTAQGS